MIRNRLDNDTWGYTSLIDTPSDAYWVGHAISKGGDYPPATVRETIVALQREGRRTLARAALETYCKRADLAPELRSEFTRALALCLLQDPTIPYRSHLDRPGRLDRARQALHEAQFLLGRTDPDLLCAAGQLEYLQWEQDGRREPLELALALFSDAVALYQHKFQRAEALERAAFLLDLLAYLEIHAVGKGNTPETALSRQAKAQRYRNAILDETADLGIESATSRERMAMAATLYGLGRSDEACAWLRAALAGDPKRGVDFESVIRQFVMLARIRTGTPRRTELTAQEPWRTLSEYFGSHTVASWLAGAVGLALSGGGFRASLFHLGVLAKLAELDLLRFVEVLSCVSGGSIVGAYYHLRLQHLLETREDRDLTQQDYVRLVERLIDDFLQAVQENIRGQALLSLRTNLRMMRKAWASRSEQIAYLLDRVFFSVAATEKQGAVLTMRSTRVRPLDGVIENWRRGAKLPELIINATALDSGLGWQITPEWMGDLAETRGDHRYVSFTGGTEYLAKEAINLSLGHAVAASAAVPGVFEPIVMPFTSQGDVLLADGGVADNQGIGALLDRGCRVMWISDASGQLVDEPLGGGGMIGSALRASEIQAKRLRDYVLEELESGVSSFVKSVAIDLRKGARLHRRGIPGDGSDNTIYGFSPKIEDMLSRIRTDLDAFCDVEAYSLMVLGYRMLEREMSEEGRSAVEASEGRCSWRFFEIESILKGAHLSPGTWDAYSILDAAESRFFKAWKVVSWLPLLTWCAVAASVFGAARWWDATFWQTVLLLTVVVCAGKLMVRRGATDIVSRLTATMLLVWFPLLKVGTVFDRMYLAAGSLARLRETVAKAAHKHD